jgi:hypothetical protein
MKVFTLKACEAKEEGRLIRRCLFRLKRLRGKSGKRSEVVASLLAVLAEGSEEEEGGDEAADAAEDVVEVLASNELLSSAAGLQPSAAAQGSAARVQQQQTLVANIDRLRSMMAGATVICEENEEELAMVEGGGMGDHVGNATEGNGACAATVVAKEGEENAQGKGVGGFTDDLREDVARELAMVEGWGMGDQGGNASEGQGAGAAMMAETQGAEDGQGAGASMVAEKEGADGGKTDEGRAMGSDGIDGGGLALPDAPQAKNRDTRVSDGLKAFRALHAGLSKKELTDQWMASSERQQIVESYSAGERKRRKL